MSALTQVATLKNPRKREIGFLVFAAVFFAASLSVAIPYCVACLHPATVGMP